MSNLIFKALRNIVNFTDNDGELVFDRPSDAMTFILLYFAIIMFISVLSAIMLIVLVNWIKGVI